MLSNPIEGELTLDNFFKVIYGEVEGWCYVATKTKGAATSWQKHWFEWPREESRLLKFILDQADKKEVYYGPALYKSRGSATKAFWKGSNFLWVDFDGNAPGPENSGLFQAGLKIQSSDRSRQHWYFKLPAPIFDLGEFERLNYKLTTVLNSDISGWDGTQVLRPPETRNHKRSSVVSWIDWNDSVLSIARLDEFEDPPTLDALPVPTELPEIQDISVNYKFKGDTWQLFKKGVQEGKRSDGLMALGYSLAEMGLSNEEILAMLLDADSRWGKFAGRNDQVERLLQIVAIARTKFPSSPVGTFKDSGLLKPYGFLDLIKTEVQLEWIWKGLLQKNGYLLLTGAPKVGKTQFSLDFAQSALLQEEFLGFPFEAKDLKIGFLSLEMGLTDLKQFVVAQSQGYSEEQLKDLQERLILFPVGQPYYLNREKERDALEEMINEYQLDGLIIDSLGSTTEHELTNEGDVKQLMDWNDRIRQRHDCFTWFIHHHRKASGDNKKPNKLADIYGSYLITARVTTALTLWDTGSKAILCIPNAVRLAEKPEPFNVYRSASLHYTADASKGLKVVDKHGKEILVDKKPEEVIEKVQSFLPENATFMDQFEN